MKVSVYGDSFACASPLADQDCSWPTLLGNCSKLTNYAVTGSSLYHQFTEFLHSHATSDRVIFLVTAWGRMWLPQHHHRHIANRHTAEALIKNSTAQVKSQLGHVIDYFTHLQVDHQEQTFHNLMVAEIQRLRPDALLIPCFDTSIRGRENSCTMMDLQAIDLVYYGLTFDQNMTGQELRHCHLNDENNVILSDKLAEWLASGRFNLSATDFVIPKAPCSQYFRLT